MPAVTMIRMQGRKLANTLACFAFEIQEFESPGLLALHLNRLMAPHWQPQQVQRDSLSKLV